MQSLLFRIDEVNRCDSAEWNRQLKRVSDQIESMTLEERMREIERLRRVRKLLKRVERDLVKPPSLYGFDVARFAHVNRDRFLKSVLRLLKSKINDFDLDFADPTDTDVACSLPKEAIRDADGVPVEHPQPE